MDSNKSKEAILSKLKKSMEEGRIFSVPPHNENSPVFPIPEDLLQTFIDELEAIGGTAIAYNNRLEIIKKTEKLLQAKGLDMAFSLDAEIRGLFADTSVEIQYEDKDFEAMVVGITQCEYLVSRTGTIVVSSAQESGRRMNVFPPIHVVFAKASQLVTFLEDALENLENKYGDNFPSLVSFVTGASRTADIEKTLVMGAHGPKELFVFIDKNE